MGTTHILRVPSCLCVIALSIGCGNEATTPLGPTAQDGAITFRVTGATGTRWASTGIYAYDVAYTVNNAGNEPVSVTIASPTLLGPRGETLAVEGRDLPLQQRIDVPPNSARSNRLLFSDGNLANPWAERVVLRMSYQASNGRARTLAAETPVAHGPPLPRVLEFSASPAQLRAGDLLTVRWNVTGATRVRLSYWVADPAVTSGPTLLDVEHAGSRTVRLESSNRRAILLVVDDWAPEIIDIDPI